MNTIISQKMIYQSPMAISIIPKLDKAGTHKLASELLKGIRGHI